jgi:hypothetical protein
VKPVSDKRRKRDAVYPQRRREVFERAGGACEVCLAAPCEQIHHIAGRGGKDPHRTENLLAVCAQDHATIHANPGWARENGYMRSRHENHDSN